MSEAQTIEPVIPLAEICEATGMKDPRTLASACKRYGVPIVAFSRNSRALRLSDYALLLQRASEA